jgi:peptidoglycan hydrolase CwlO-like protein
MDIGTVQSIILICGFAVTLAAFFFTRVKEAENRGRLMQRVDELEKTIDKLMGRTAAVEEDVSCHDSDLSELSTKIESLKEKIDGIDKKLDRLIERRSEERKP